MAAIIIVNKRTHKCSVALLFLLALSFTLFANDGSYYVNGNQLIPIVEANISVKKEILTITRRNKEQVEISVYYEFFNPGAPKSLVVGFEAFPPGGGADPEPKNGQHPNIYDFTVNMNNKSLTYDVAIVRDSTYFEDGNFKTLHGAQMEKTLSEYGWMGMLYVYHFNANFKRGLNIIRHTYICDLSGSVDFLYSFDYVLTAATRWANKQIDDFTLIVDMGEFQHFFIDDSVFGETPDWKIKGEGTINSGKSYINYWAESNEKRACTAFIMRRGQIEYRAMNFAPRDELYIHSYQPLAFLPMPFDCSESPLPYNITIQSDYVIEAADDLSRRILRNLPFARRGYIFSSPELNNYFSNQYWYTPDPHYKAILSELPTEEQKWVAKYGISIRNSQLLND